jgi:membrane protein YdbS with pleckstrin-like domain
LPHDRDPEIPASAESSPAPDPQPVLEPEAEVLPASDDPREAQIADGRSHLLDPDSVTVTRITAGGWIAGLGFVNLIGWVLIAFLAPAPVWIKSLMLAAWAAIHGGLAVYAMWWAGLRYRHTSYRIDPLGFTIRRGVIFRSINSVPRSRIQHTDVSQGPLQRAYKLATLIVHTAGTANASISLSGLTHDDALKIRDHLIEVGDSDAV